MGSEGPKGLVSVVLPTYRRTWSLGQSIESVLSQTYRSLELLVGEDGRDPAIPKVVEQHARGDTRLRFTQLPHRGIYPTLNALIERARGEYVAIFSDDDVLDERFLERCVAAADEAHAFVYADFFYWYPETNRRVDSRVGALGRCPMNLNAILFRRWSLEAIRDEFGSLFDSSLHQYGDTLILHRMEARGFAHGHVHEPLLDYRMHEGQWTRRVTFQSILDYIGATRRMGPEHAPTLGEVLRRFGWIASRKTGLTRNRLLGRG